MYATIWLLSSMLLSEQTASGATPPKPAPMVRGDWQFTPKLNRGQELLYRGQLSEETRGSQVQFNRTFRLENRIFTLDSKEKGTELAVLTILQDRSSKPMDSKSAKT
ncbi:MAG: hypothetical protein ACKO23_14685, partial [Gemmataceae bacterium]